MNIDVAQASAKYRAAGLSPLPTKLTTKRPSVANWGDYQKQQMPVDLLLKEVAQAGGVGIATGFSGVEALDFDLKGHAWTAWRRAVCRTDPELFARLYIEQSPSGGMHVIYRVQDESVLEGSRKLAIWNIPTSESDGEISVEKAGKPLSLTFSTASKSRYVEQTGTGKKLIVKNGHVGLCPIETRGTGGFLVIAPTPGYRRLSGSLEDLPSLTVAERQTLIAAAEGIGDALVTQVMESTEKSLTSDSEDEDLRLGTWYNKHGSHTNLLQKHGWTLGVTKNGNEHWTRPGKSVGDGTSATWDVEKRLFYVFSSNAPIPESSSQKNHAYTLFNLLAWLETGQDYAKAYAIVRKLHPEAIVELNKKELAKLGREAGESIVGKIEAILERSLSTINPAHARVYVRCLQEMEKMGLSFDALGVIRYKGALTAVTMPRLANRLGGFLRCDKHIGESVIAEALENIRHYEATQRHQKLMQKMTGHPSAPEGERELEKWLGAVKEGWTEADKVAIKHLMWNVKRKALSLAGANHHMVILYNPAQGVGKSKAAWAFISPWEELSVQKFEARQIIDERCTQTLSQLVIANIDEMAGMATADLEELKSRITADSIGFRPMRTNDYVPLPMRTSFIATSNKCIGDIVRDRTGIRRFYEIKTRDMLDWQAINEVDYVTMWRCVSENDPAPGEGVGMHLLAAARKGSEYQDVVDRWLEWEAEGEQDVDGDVVWTSGVQSVSMPEKGLTSEELFRRHMVYCQTHGEKNSTFKVIRQRLEEMGWVMKRPWVGQKLQTRVLVRPTRF